MTTWVYVLIASTSVWVYFDAKKIGARRGLVSGFFNMGPLTWAICCLLLWILSFPAYLTMRSRIVEAAGNDPETTRSANVKQSIPNTIAKYVAICWTLLFAFFLVAGLQALSESAPSAADSYSVAGYAIGASIGFGMYFFIWAIVAIPAFIVFMVTKRSGSVAVVDQQQSTPEKTDTKNCPFCAETIKKEAIICRFCNRSLEIGTPEQQHPDKRIKSKIDWFGKAKDLLKKGEIKEGIAACSKAIEQNASGDAHYLRAVAYSKAKDKKRMRADLEAAAALGHEKAIQTLASFQQ